MTRADALRELIERVEAGKTALSLKDTIHVAQTIGASEWIVPAFDGSLDAVARLEAPLRGRGWLVYCHERVDRWKSCLWQPEPHAEAAATAPTEARARLLAVLKAMLHEEENGHDPA